MGVTETSITNSLPERCICQGRGRYYVAALPNIRYYRDDETPDFFSLPRASEASCPFHGLPRLSATDREMLNAAGIG